MLHFFMALAMLSGVACAQQSIYPSRAVVNFGNMEIGTQWWGNYDIDMDSGKVKWIYPFSKKVYGWGGTGIGGALFLQTDFVPDSPEYWRLFPEPNTKGKVKTLAVSLADGSVKWSQNIPGIRNFGDVCSTQTRNLPGTWSEGPKVVASEQFVLVGTCKLHVLEPTTGKWLRSIALSKMNGAAFAGTVGYVSLYTGLHAANLSTGELLWSYTWANSSRASEVVLSSDGAVAFFVEKHSDKTGILHAVKTLSGSKLWSVPIAVKSQKWWWNAPAVTANDAVDAPAVTANAVVVTTCLGLEAFDVMTGRHLWVYHVKPTPGPPLPPGTSTCSQAGIQGAPAVGANGTVLVLGYDPETDPRLGASWWVAAIGAEDGVQRWRRFNYTNILAVNESHVALLNDAWYSADWGEWVCRQPGECFTGLNVATGQVAWQRGLGPEKYPITDATVIVV